MAQVMRSAMFLILAHSPGSCATPQPRGGEKTEREHDNGRETGQHRPRLRAFGRDPVGLAAALFEQARFKTAELGAQQFDLPAKIRTLIRNADCVPGEIDHAQWNGFSERGAFLGASEDMACPCSQTLIDEAGKKILSRFHETAFPQLARTRKVSRHPHGRALPFHRRASSRKSGRGAHPAPGSDPWIAPGRTSKLRAGNDPATAPRRKAPGEAARE